MLHKEYLGNKLMTNQELYDEIKALYESFEEKLSELLDESENVIASERRVIRAYRRYRDALQDASEDMKENNAEFGEFKLDEFLRNPQPSQIIDPIDLETYKILRDRAKDFIKELRRYIRSRQ